MFQHYSEKLFANVCPACGRTERMLTRVTLCMSRVDYMHACTHAHSCNTPWQPARCVASRECKMCLFLRCLSRLTTVTQGTQH